MSDDLHATLRSAGIDPAQLGPFGAIVEAVDALVQARLDSAAGDLRAARASAEAAALLAASEDGLRPDHDYLPAQAAAFLGVKVSTYHAIPRDLLPRREGGYARGIDIMSYRGDVSHEEARAYKEAKVAAVRRLIDG